MKTAKKKIGLYDAMKNHSINRISGSIKNEAAKIENLEKVKNSLSEELEKAPAGIIRIENISLLAEKYAELSAKKKEFESHLSGLGVIRGTSKLTIWVVKFFIVIFLAGGVIYRMMGWRSMEENVPPLLDMFTLGTFKFPTVVNALFLEGTGVVIISFLLFRIFGNNHREDNRKKFFLISLIAAGVTVASVVLYTIL